MSVLRSIICTGAVNHKTIAELISCLYHVACFLPGEKDMMLLGIISCVADNSPTTRCTKKGQEYNHERKRQRSYYLRHGRKICRDTFMFLYRYDGIFTHSEYHNSCVMICTPPRFAGVMFLLALVCLFVC